MQIDGKNTKKNNSVFFVEEAESLEDLWLIFTSRSQGSFLNTPYPPINKTDRIDSCYQRFIPQMLHVGNIYLHVPLNMAIFHLL